MIEPLRPDEQLCKADAVDDSGPHLSGQQTPTGTDGWLAKQLKIGLPRFPSPPIYRERHISGSRSYLFSARIRRLPEELNRPMGTETAHLGWPSFIQECEDLKGQHQRVAV
jgi:hypothetical protein